MDLMGQCLRCGKAFCGPDEGCPTCDKGNPDVTSDRNHHPSEAEVAAFYEIQTAGDKCRRCGGAGEVKYGRRLSRCPMCATLPDGYFQSLDHAAGL